MASENLMAQVSTGMEVRTADNQSLGKVVEIWVGTDPTASNPLWDDEICSRLEVQSGGLFNRSTLYVPYSAIGYVAVDHLILNIDAATVQERPWSQKPPWIAA